MGGPRPDGPAESRPPSPLALARWGLQGQGLTSSNSAVSFCRSACSPSRVASVRSSCVFSCVETPHTDCGKLGKDPRGDRGSGRLHLLAATGAATGAPSASPCLRLPPCPELPLRGDGASPAGTELGDRREALLGPLLTPGAFSESHGASPSRTTPSPPLLLWGQAPGEGSQPQLFGSEVWRASALLGTSQQGPQRRPDSLSAGPASQPP